MKMCKFVQINSFRKDLSGSKQKDRKNDKNRGSRDVPQAAGLRCLRVARRAADAFTSLETRSNSLRWRFSNFKYYMHLSQF